MNRDVGFCLSKSGSVSYPTYESEKWPLKRNDPDPSKKNVTPCPVS
jgi:hypothetical protein